MHTSPVLCGSVVAVCAALGGFWSYTRSPAPPPHALVIVTLDTTRADRLSAYGFMDVAMPALDRLAREGAIFDRASSVAPLTLPAHTSLFTGMFPPAHGVRDNSGQPLAPARTTLAEILGGQGFRTGAFVGSIVLDADRGLAQGFDVYDDVAGDGPGQRHPRAAPQRRADEVITEALRWLDTVGDERFFLWAHLYDPHRPYDPPEPFGSMHADPYVGEIAFADSQLGRLLEALDRRRLTDRTIVVVAGDHGESLGEHGERDHGILLYESVLRVPLLIRGRGALPGRTAAPVRLIDVMPTVLDMLEVPTPPMDGVSLVPVMGGEPKQAAVPEAYAESLYPRMFGCSPLRAVNDGRFKLIEGPRPELYDLHQDPFEQRNVHGERPRVAEGLRRRLAALESRAPAGSAPSPDTAVPVARQKNLASLGYVSLPAEAAPLGALADPKDCLDRVNRTRPPGR